MKSALTESALLCWERGERALLAKDQVPCPRECGPCEESWALGQRSKCSGLWKGWLSVATSSLPPSCPSCWLHAWARLGPRPLRFHAGRFLRLDPLPRALQLASVLTMLPVLPFTSPAKGGAAATSLSVASVPRGGLLGSVLECYGAKSICSSITVFCFLIF